MPPNYSTAPKTDPQRKRGKKQVKLQKAVEALGQLARKLLKGISDKELKAQFKAIAGITTLKKARVHVLQNNSDKLREKTISG
jgi:hypothetical protein